LEKPHEVKYTEESKEISESDTTGALLRGQRRLEKVCHRVTYCSRNDNDDDDDDDDDGGGGDDDDYYYDVTIWTSVQHFISARVHIMPKKYML